MTQGTVVYVLFDGVWKKVHEPRWPGNANFVIVCDYGDWSGFRTLGRCLSQIPDGWRDRPNGFFQIVEA